MMQKGRRRVRLRRQAYAARRAGSIVDDGFQALFVFDD
jgi:hypothetical protein